MAISFDEAQEQIDSSNSPSSNIGTQTIQPPGTPIFQPATPYPTSANFQFQPLPSQPTLPQLNSSGGLFFQASSNGISSFSTPLPTTPIPGTPSNFGFSNNFTPVPGTPYQSYPSTPISNPTPTNQPSLPSSPALAYGITESQQNSDALAYGITFLTQLEASKKTQDEQLKKICSVQKTVLQNPTTENVQSLNSEHQRLKAAIDTELKQLDEFDRSIFMSTKELKKFISLQQELQLQNMQLELYHQELQQLRSQQSSRKW